jgi:argininosuccinate synthase
LYDAGLATYEGRDVFDHAAAEGFIKIFGLPLETGARQAITGKRKTSAVTQA